MSTHIEIINPNWHSSHSNFRTLDRLQWQGTEQNNLHLATLQIFQEPENPSVPTPYPRQASPVILANPQAPALSLLAPSVVVVLVLVLLVVVLLLLVVECVG